MESDREEPVAPPAAMPQQPRDADDMNTSDAEPPAAEEQPTAEAMAVGAKKVDAPTSKKRTRDKGDATHTESEDALPGFKDKWSVAIDRMVEERKALKLEQRLKTKAIRKTIRQKRRTMKNAKKLTDDELSQIVLDRRILDLVEREAKAAGVKSSSSSATSTAST